MDGSKLPPLSSQDLYSASGVGRASLVLDVRHAAAFDADETLLVGALRRDSSTVESWRNALPKDLKVLVYCAHGQEDIPGAEPFSHDGELGGFDAFLKVYGVEDPALDALAVIARGADTARLELVGQSPGLLALSLGLSVNFADDHEMLEAGMVMYDAIYA
jgi:rhodanese-related sulfurtransferase